MLRYCITPQNINVQSFYFADKTNEIVICVAYEQNRGFQIKNKHKLVQIGQYR